MPEFSHHDIHQLPTEDVLKRLETSNGLSISVGEFERHFTEHQVAYSNALHCTLRGLQISM